MRLRNLQLLRFGHFTDHELVFSRPGKGLHVIYGDNEAGKSTALRSISALLFGVEERTRDAHLHAAKDLRVGALLENDAGETLHVIRRKGRKDTLLDEKGRPIPEGQVQAYTGGISREVFEAMFGLDHPRLVAGGRDLLAGHGEVGRALFGAAAGVRGLHELLSRLQDEAGEVFKRAGSKPRLNQALKRYQEARKNVREHALKPSEWVTAKRALDDAQAALEEIRQTCAALGTRLDARKRVKDALSDVRAYDAIVERRETLGTVRQLPEDAAEQRRNADSTRIRASVELDELAAEEQQLREEDSNLHVPEVLLALEARIAALAEARGAYRKAIADRIGLASKLEAGGRELETLLRQLPLPKSPAQIESLEVDDASQVRIRELAREGGQLEERIASRRENVREAEARARKADRELQALPVVPDATALQSAVDAARLQGDLEAQLRDLTAQLGTEQKRAQRLTEALPLWQGTPEAAAALSLPLDETLQRFEREFTDVEKREHTHAEKTQGLGDERTRLREEIAALESQGSIPTARELESLRERRDGLWASIRGVWLGGSSEARTPAALAGDYEASVQVADSLGDQRFVEHKRVAQLEGHHVRVAELEESLRSLEEEAEALRERRAALEQDWRAAWEPAGIEPASLREMRDWKLEHQEVAGIVAAISELEERATALDASIAAHRRACAEAHTALDAAEPAPSLGLRAILDIAGKKLAAIRDAQQQRDQLTQTLAGASEDRGMRKDRLEETEAEREEWRGRWESAIAALHLPATARPEEAEAVLERLSQAFRKHAELSGHRDRIEHIDADSQELAEEIEEIARAACPDLPSGTPDVRADDLLSRLTRARESRARSEVIRTRLRQIAASQEKATRQRDTAAKDLASYVERAGVDNADALDEAERRSTEMRELDRRLAEVKERLDRTGRPLDALLAEAREAEAEALALEIEDLEQELGDLEGRREEAARQAENCEREFEAMDGGTAAAEASDEAEVALAEITQLTSEYALKQAAAVVLGRELQRYAEKNQGPILSRASELFEHCTRGRYEGISSEFSEGDEAILVCNRAGQSTVGVEGLSDGTRDQLYLSLRLAALEQHMRENESMPLVVDDVLITFDDPRAKATLEALGTLAETAQVLFFTHHRRLVELAQEAVPEALLEMHELGA